MKESLKLNARRIAVIVFVLIFAGVTYINLRGSYLEYKELGENYLNIFWTNLTYKYAIMAINFAILYFIMYFYGRSIKKGLKIFFEQEKKEIPKLPNKSISLVVSTIVSVVVSEVFLNTLLLFNSGVTFERTDSIFNLDISFFVFKEPLIKMMLVYLIVLIIGLTIYSALYYIFIFNKYFDGVDREIFKKSGLVKTIFRNAKVLAIIFAIYNLTGTLDIVFHNFLTTDNHIKLVGAGFIDSTIRLVGNVIFSLLIIFVVFKIIADMKNNRSGKIIKTAIIIPAYLVILFLIIMVFNFVFIRPNKFDKEKRYIEANIESTKKAYGIETEKETVDYSGTINEIQKNENQNVINNASMVSKDIILNTLNYNQTGAGYYKYTNTSIGKYLVNDVEKVMYISPREIVSNKRTYNSKTYEYTHGYGVILTDASNYNESGEVKYIQNDITGKEQTIKIENPQIYYGLETNYTAITASKKIAEYDYTLNGIEYQSSYSGNSGLKLGFFDRLVLGLKNNDLNLAFTSDLTQESKILINRNIIKRAQKAIPDILYDDSPYMVVADGQMYWVLDAYTVSDKYPYSTYTQIIYNNERRDINYIKNSIKVITNATTGEMKFYITDRTDPIAMAYWNMYRDAFQNLEEQIPESISSKFVYPKYLYDIQASVLLEYHNNKADVLYRSDDTWEKATYNANATTKSSKNILDSYYTLIKTNGKEEVGLLQMFMPKGKQSINAYLEGYVENGINKLKIKTLSSDETILIPSLLDTQISQNPIIQEEIDALSATGMKVTKNMLIVPIDNTLLYIEPIYQTATNENNIPILKKVIVASGNKVAIGENLNRALQNLLSQTATNINLEDLNNTNDLIESIIKANGNLSDSLDSKDWELIGSDIKKLQELINLLDRRRVNTNSIID